MKAREFFLLILIVAAGVLFYHIQTGKLALDFDWEDGIFLGFNEYVFEESIELEPPFPGELQLINSHGVVDIEGTAEDRISIKMTKRIRRRDEKRAEEVAAELRTVTSRDERRVTVTSNRGDFRSKNFRTDFSVTLPARMAVNIKNSHGSAKIVNVAEGEISNTHGEITAIGIAGDLTIRNGYEDVVVDDVRGDCQIDSRHSSVQVSRIEGRLHISHRYGRIDLKEIAREATIESAHSEINGRDMNGPLEIETSYEPIFLTGVGPALLRGHHSSIEVQAARERLEIQDRSGHITVKGLRGDLNIAGKSLKITAEDVKGKSIVIDTSYQDVDLAAFSGRTTITLTHGNLRLAPDPLAGDIEVKALHSQILFIWPGSERYPFEAQNKGGQIEWELDQEPEVRLDNGSSIVKAFLGEAPRPAIKLSTSYAPIRIFRRK